MRRFKICILTERMLTGFGADLVIHRIAKGLASEGYEVEVVSSIKDGSLDDPDYLNRLLPIPASTYFPAYEANARREIGRILALNYDLIIVGTFPFFALIPELSESVPCIALEFGVCPTVGFSLWAKYNFAYMKQSQMNAYFDKATRIICISEYLKQQLPQVLQAKADVIYCGVDHYPLVNDLQTAGQSIRKQLGVSSDEILALYVGRVNPDAQPYKGTRELIDIYKQARAKTEFRLLMVGRGTPEDAALLNVNGILAYLNVPASELPAIYSACDIFVTCSKWEGFGLPLAEAQYYGKPFVAYSVGAHPEIAESGKAGFLVKTKSEFQESLVRLIEDRQLRQTFSENACEQMKVFRWEKAIEAYSKVVSTVIKGTPVKTVSFSKTTRISIVIVTYEAPVNMLARCLESLHQQTMKDIEIIIVDNSPSLSQPEALYRQYEAQVIKLDKNRGFAYAVNCGVEHAVGEYVLVSNFDVEYSPTAIAQMLAVMETDIKIAGVAPKTLLVDSSGPYIDNVGIVINSHFQAFNMGIGQLDLGQYDVSEGVFGACFAAALLRKSALQITGPLDEDYFMYFEDVDWCYRANAKGFVFRTAPLAVVHHIHSAATKSLPYSFKYVLIQLNLLRTIVKNCAGYKQMLLLLGLTLRSHAVNVIWRRIWVRSTIKILFLFLKSLPQSLQKRKQLQSHRIIPDGMIWRYSHGEQPFFDPVGYAPLKSIDALTKAVSRRALLTGRSHDQLVVQKLNEVNQALAVSKLRWEDEVAKRKLYEIANDLQWTQEEKNALTRYIDGIVL